MVLAYQNGERCGNGVTRQVKYTISCSENFGYDDGPMVVYESRRGCHYDVHWPNRAGCPTNGGALSDLTAGQWGTGSVAALPLCLSVSLSILYPSACLCLSLSVCLQSLPQSRYILMLIL